VEATFPTCFFCCLLQLPASHAFIISMVGATSSNSAATVFVDDDDNDNVSFGSR
jgi:hypothetical protein